MFVCVCVCVVGPFFPQNLYLEVSIEDLYSRIVTLISVVYFVCVTQMVRIRNHLDEAKDMFKLPSSLLSSHISSFLSIPNIP